MAAEPSRELVPGFPVVGFLHQWHVSIDATLRTGELHRAALDAAACADLAERFGDVVTAVKVRLLGALALLGDGDPTGAEAAARAGLAMIEGLSPADPTASAVIAHGAGSLPPDALPAHARFWRAEALALLARASVNRGQLRAAMDSLADAIAGIEDTEPRTVDDAAACLIVANALGSVALLEPSAALAARALAVTDRLAARSSDAFLLGIRTALARRSAEASALLAGYSSLTPIPGRTFGHFAAAASSALRHQRAAAASSEPTERDAALVFLAFAEQGLREPTDDGLLELAEEAAVEKALDRLDGTIVVGPARGGGPLGRIVLAQLRAQRRQVDAARAVLDEGERAHPRAEQGISLWYGLAGITRAQVEDQEEHAAVALWRELALTVGVRQWRERDARFHDLRQRIAQRQLRWRRAATEGELLRDPLTGLGNRRRLEIELDREVSSVLFLDVDRFKQINDECGHEAGDVVLRRVAGILRACCRAPDVVIRYGGDEFVVILDRGSDARALGERVIGRIRRDEWSDVTGGIPVTVSIGAASAPTLREALRQSDIAMLRAKQAGRDGLLLAAVPGDSEPGPVTREGHTPGDTGFLVAANGGGMPASPAGLNAGSLRTVTGGSASRGILVRPDDAGGLLPLLRESAADFYRGEWSAAGQGIDALIRLARLLGDRATLRDARLLGLRVLEQQADWPRLLEAAHAFIDDAEYERPTPARAVALGVLASALQQEGRIAEALAAVAEGYELITHGTGWATHRALACFTLSTPLCAALLFEPGMELLALGEKVARTQSIQPWAVLTASRFASRRARAEALRGYFVELIGDNAAADRHYRAGAEHALRARRDADAGTLLELRAEAILTVTVQRLRMEPVDRALLARHVAAEPFPRVSLLSRLTMASVDARAGAVDSARRIVESVLIDAPRVGDLVLTYVATAWAAQLEEGPHGDTVATRQWRRIAEHLLGRLWADRVGRFDALVSARQMEALSAAVESERNRLWEDPLTAVGNRRLLDRLLADPVMAARPTAFVDIDWFKEVNDRFGHEVGDEVLHRVARQLVAASRAGDVVVRYGGDEFVIVLDEGSNVEAYCERVRRGVADHLWDSVQPGLRVTVTVGGVQAGPRSMSRADTALRQAKGARAARGYSALHARECPA